METLEAPALPLARGSARGTTVLILAPEGAEALLGKCRCESGSVLFWFLTPSHRRPECFATLWEAFIAPRMRGCRERCKDIESTYSDTGYRFALAEPVPPLPGHQLAQALLAEGERQLRLEGGWDGLLERFGTALILVDLRGPGTVSRHRSVEGAWGKEI